MTQKTIVILFVCLCFSCNSKPKPEKPNNLIPKDQMATLLYDVFLVNVAKNTDARLLELKNVNPEAYILNKYGVDSTQFKASNAYYAYDIDGYKEIMDAVKAQITEAKKKYEALQEEEKNARVKKKDSMIKANRIKKEDVNF